MKRSDMRELAFKVIYSKFFNQSDDELFDSNTDSASLDFITNILHQFADHYTEINDLISKHLKGYTIDRLYKIDLAILILAIIEIKYLDTPKQVAINEAVELAKKFSTDNSPKFVNGVLADIVRE